jgi:hypothetical protein
MDKEEAQEVGGKDRKSNEMIGQKEIMTAALRE